MAAAFSGVYLPPKMAVFRYLRIWVSLEICTNWAGIPYSARLTRWSVSFIIYYMDRCGLLELKNEYNGNVGGYPGFEMIDLGDFDHPRLSEEGELEVPRAAFKHGPLTLELGGRLGEAGAAILNVGYYTSGDINESAKLFEDRSAVGFYAVSNPDNGQVLYLDDAQKTLLSSLALEGRTPDGHRYGLAVEILGGRALVIGAGDNDHELGFGPQVDPEHVKLRIGNVGRNVHILDLITRGGTRVYVPTEAYKEIQNKTRYFKQTPDGKSVTHERIHGGWSRPKIGGPANC